jgi:hypothetical protein
MPYDGWAWEWNPNSSGYWRNFWVTPVENGTEQACPSISNPPGIPEGLTEVQGAPHPNCNAYWNGGDNGGVAHMAAVVEDGLGAPAPGEDYSSQPFERDTCCWTDQPQTRTQLEDPHQAGI